MTTLSESLDRIEAEWQGPGSGPEWQRLKCSAKSRAVRKRQQLIADLGGKCAYCGAEDNLHFHHLARRTWQARDYNPWTRMNLYLRDHERGILTLACRSCNSRLGKPQPKPRKGKRKGA